MKESNLMTKENIVGYLVEDFKIFNSKNDLICEEIGDGNINYVFKVKENSTGKSVVVKQADSLLRSSGRPLDIYRSKIESDVLKIQNKLHPGSVPEVYHYDEEKALIIMEDISEYGNLRLELKDGVIYSHLPDSLSKFLSRTLIPMTDLVLDRGIKKEYVKKYINPELCDITEDLVLTEPYFDYKNRNVITPGMEDFVKENLYDNLALHKEVLILKDRFQNLSQSLIHGDLHLGSIFANENGIKVIDPEFAFYGSIGYDVGNVWGNLFFPLANHIIRGSSEITIKELKKLIIETIDRTIIELGKSYDEFVTDEYLKNKSFKVHYLKEIVSDSFGFAGTEIIRRVVGDAKVIEVTSLDDLVQRRKLDELLIRMGMKLILNRNILAEGKYVISEFESIVMEII